MMAYVVFGLLVLFIHVARQLPQRNLYYLLIVAFSLAGLWMVSQSFQINYSFNYGFLRGILGFFTGVLCFNLFSISNENVRKWPSFIFSVSELLSLTFITLCIYNGEILKPYGVIFEFLFFICIYTFSFEKGFISVLLKKPVLLHRLGKYSYSIYMTHALFISLFNVLFIRILKFPPSAYSWLFILNFILIYFVSVWTYKNIEMRFQYKSAKKSPLVTKAVS